MRFSTKIEILIFSAVIVTGMFLVFSPILVSRENSVMINSTVNRITKGSENNVILKLQDRQGIYYINQGLKKGLNLDSLQKLVNKQVTVLYLKPSFVSGFTPVADTKHITELRVGEKLIYSEL